MKHLKLLAIFVLTALFCCANTCCEEPETAEPDTPGSESGTGGESGGESGSDTQGGNDYSPSMTKKTLIGKWKGSTGYIKKGDPHQFDLEFTSDGKLIITRNLVNYDSSGKATPISKTINANYKYNERNGVLTFSNTGMGYGNLLCFCNDRLLVIWEEGEEQGEYFIKEGYSLPLYSKMDANYKEAEWKSWNSLNNLRTISYSSRSFSIQNNYGSQSSTHESCFIDMATGIMYYDTKHQNPYPWRILHVDKRVLIWGYMEEGTATQCEIFVFQRAD